MAFVNEYITEEDKEKYGLDLLWKKYDHSYKKNFPSKKGWTIDREKEIWLMEMAGILDDSVFDHAYSSEQIWTLYCQGQSVEVRLEVSSDKEFNGKKYNKIWNLLAIYPDSLNNLSIDELIKLMEEILEVFGYEGVWMQYPNYTVALRDCRNYR